MLADCYDITISKAAHIIGLLDLVIHETDDGRNHTQQRAPFQTTLCTHRLCVEDAETHQWQRGCR